MSKWLYIEINAWFVDGVMYANESLAQLASLKHGKPVEQCYRRVLNPDWKQ